VAGYDEADPFSAPVPLQISGPHAVRVGVIEQFADVPVQEPMREAVRKAACVLETLGFRVEPFDITGLESAPGLWWFFFAELAAPFTKELFDRPDSGAHWTGLEFLRMQEPLRTITGREVVENLGARDRLRRLLLSRMQNTPVLLLPACGVAAFRYREREWDVDGCRIGLREAMTPAVPFNLVGFPAMAIPFGFTPEGLPVGIQLVGRPWEEERILELAVRMEEARGPFPLPAL
jgi:Asp-tRNA(Asn)/Glu-tRNA(Gln) amidotransferase A subunit family amidase